MIVMEGEGEGEENFIGRFLGKNSFMPYYRFRFLLSSGVYLLMGSKDGWMDTGVAMEEDDTRAYYVVNRVHLILSLSSLLSIVRERAVLGEVSLAQRRL